MTSGLTSPVADVSFSIYDPEAEALAEAQRARLAELELAAGESAAQAAEERAALEAELEGAKQEAERVRAEEKAAMEAKLEAMEAALAARDAEVEAERKRAAEAEEKARAEAEEKARASKLAQDEAAAQAARADDLERKAADAAAYMEERESTFELEKQKNAEEHRLWMAKMEEEERARLEEIEKLRREQEAAAEAAKVKAEEAARLEAEKARAEDELAAKQAAAQAEAEAAARERRAQELEVKRLQMEKDKLEKRKPKVVVRGVARKTFEDTWNLEIVTAHERDVGSSKPYTSYEIKIRLNGDNWRVFRRFSEFERFHKLMKSRIPSVANYIPFPKKKMFQKSTDPDVVRQRRQDLEIYLINVISKSFQNPQSPFYLADRSSLQRTIPFFRPGQGL
eukprot:UC1_evm1s1073